MDIVEQLFNDVDVQVICSISSMITQANDLIWNQNATRKHLCENSLSPSYEKNDLQQCS